MKAITLTQPWATLMAAGEKRIETRSWSPRGLHMGEPVAIHAGAGLAGMSQGQFAELCRSNPFREAIDRAWERGLIPTEPGGWGPSDLPRGCVVAVAEFLTAFRTSSDSCGKALAHSMESGSPFERDFGNYGEGRWAWIFSRIHPLTEPIAARGALGLWHWAAPEHLTFAESEGSA